MANDKLDNARNQIYATAEMMRDQLTDFLNGTVKTGPEDVELYGILKMHAIDSLYKELRYFIMLNSSYDTQRIMTEINSLVDLKF